jgi:SAM-dependent methyltransferase
MRPQDWAFFAAVIAVVVAITATLQGALTSALAGIAMTVAAAWVSHTLSHRYPGPMSHHFRWGLLLPRGFHSPRRLRKILQPRSGERILELGPGIGAHALPLAASLAPTGTLAVLDIQQPMLNHLVRRTIKAGVINIVPTVGDGQRLPFASASFDAVYLIDVLGETSDLQAVLQELRRVLRADGRLVIGEHFVDPDFVSLRSLKKRAEPAGFAFECKSGTSLVYFACFRPK